MSIQLNDILVSIAEQCKVPIEDVEEKISKENFRVNREMRDEILVYDLFLTKFWTKMGSKCKENAVKFLILGFRVFRARF